MKVLIIYAHPESNSFNGALKDRAVETLQSLGHEVIVSDLYRMGWKSQIDSDDIPGERVNNAVFVVHEEQENMENTTGATLDVRKEQEKLVWCDVLIFQFPIWWFSMPAILKGWVDRTFTRGFAYKAGRKYSAGMFKGKKAIICATTGTSGSLYMPDGIDGDINHILWPIHNGIFNYTGFDVLPPHMVWMPGNLSAPERQNELAKWEERVRHLDNETPLYFHGREDFTPDQRLRPDVVAKTGFQWNPTAGQTHEEAAQQYTNRLNNDK